MPVKVVPHGVEDFMRPMPPTLINMNQGTILYLHGVRDKFKMLNVFTVSSFPHRKGIDLLLQAYFEEFTTEDQVMLVIRTEDRKYLQDLCREHNPGKKMLDHYLIDETVRFTPEELAMLYNSCDCYVHPSRGEAWGMDLSNAIACGLSTISTKYSGMLDYADKYSRWVDIEENLIPGTCYRNDGGLYAQPKLSSLRAAMRAEYEEWKAKPAKSRSRHVRESDTFRERWSWDNAARVAIAAAKELTGEK